MGSFRIRDQTCVSYIGRQNLYHSATREAPLVGFFNMPCLSSVTVTLWARQGIMSHSHILQVKKMSLQVVKAQMSKMFSVLSCSKMAASWRYRRDQKVVNHLTLALISLIPLQIPSCFEAMSRGTWSKHETSQPALHWVICNVFQPWHYRNFM